MLLKQNELTQEQRELLLSLSLPNVNRYGVPLEEAKQKARQRNRESDRKRFANRRSPINDYKTAKGCGVCGYKKCAQALDFHHIKGNKEFNISDMIRTDKTIDEMRLEMSKCIILCRNCHAELHAKEQETRRNSTIPHVIVEETLTPQNAVEKKEG